MKYEVRIDIKAEKKLETINKPDYSSIKSAILKLGENPRPNGYIKLKGRDGFRIRVGNYRIIYDIFDNKLVVIVITISHRKDIYR